MSLPGEKKEEGRPRQIKQYMQEQVWWESPFQENIESLVQDLWMGGVWEEE